MKMKYILPILKWLYLVISTFCLFLVLYYWITSYSLDTLSNFGEFFGGIFGTLLLVMTLLFSMVISYREFKINNFFKMLDFHTRHRKNIKISIKFHPSSKKYKFNQYPLSNDATLPNLIQTISSIQNICYNLNDTIESKKRDINLSDRQAFAELVEVFKKNLHCLSESSCHLTTEKQIIFAYILSIHTREKLTKIIENSEHPIYALSHEDKRELLRITQSFRLISAKYEVSIYTLLVYFQNLYNAIRFIDTSFLTEQNKKELITLLRSQLSNPELIILALNTLTPDGEKWIQHKFIQKYQLMDNIDTDRLPSYVSRYLIKKLKIQ